MPGVPIEMPSDTVMVLNVIALAPARSAADATNRASSSMWTLQGVKLLQVDAMPTWGLWKSSSPNPTARSMARLGVCFTPSTTSREYRLASTLAGFLPMPPRLRNAKSFNQVAVGAAHGLSLAAHGSAGPILGIPGVEIDVHPGRFSDEALQEQSAEYRARKPRGCNVVQRGDLAGQFVVVSGPERHGP